LSCLSATLKPSSSFGYYFFRQVNEELGCRDEKNSNGKPGRKYQGEVIELKGFSTFL